MSLWPTALYAVVGGCTFGPTALDSVHSTYDEAWDEGVLPNTHINSIVRINPDASLVIVFQALTRPKCSCDHEEVSRIRGHLVSCPFYVPESQR